MTARRVCAAIWLVLVAAAVIGRLLDVPLTFFAWFGALIMLGGSGSIVLARREERLERPRIYRITAGVAFALPLGAALLVEVPHHSEWATLFAPYFALVAWLQYRALVARGPRPALMAMCVAMLAWLPFVVFTFMGCKCHYVAPPPHWTDDMPEAWLQLTTARACSP